MILASFLCQCFFQRWSRLCENVPKITWSRRICRGGHAARKYMVKYKDKDKEKKKITCNKGIYEEGETWPRSHCKLSAMLEMTGIGPLLPFGRWHLIWAHFPGNPLRMNIEILNIFARIIKFLLKISLFSFSLIPTAAAGFQKVQLVRGISF